ncbi:hypothetical protein ES703_50579 [subsurface metagenome]
MKVKNLLLLIKVAFLVVLGLIMVIGSLGWSARGALWACPFPVPFIMCSVCPVYCTFGQIRQWLFYGILASGLVMGRVFCGAFCPIGIAQELAAKVPLPKISLPRSLDRVLRYLKYVLAILVAGLVIEATGVWTGLPLMGKVWSFLTMHTDGMRIARLVSIPILLIVGLFVVRAWCKYLCPVGTWMSPFNRFSLVGLKRDSEKCVTCGVCDQKCSRPSASDGDEDVWDSIECVRCLQCYTECQGKAFDFKNRLRG